MAGQMQGALADLLREIGRMDRRLDALQAVETDTAGGGGGSGTVTSVALALPAILTVSGSPVTTAGTLTAVLANQSANLVFAGPASGAAAAPTFRALAALDMAASVAGTIGAIAKFTAANVVGNSIITESGAAISVAGSIAAVGQSNTNQLILKGFSTQTAGQILIQTSAAAELGRIYINATYSLAIGYQAGAALGASTGSVLIGYQAGNALVSNDLVAIGYQAGYSCTAARNVFIGKNAGRLTVGGDYNVAIGEGALASNVSGQSSFALGYGALGLATASENVAIGASALQKCTTGYYNVGIGTLALGELLGATGNCALGQSALRYVVSGTDNTAMGTSAGYATTGSNNVMIGHSAGAQITGSNNVCIGWHSGHYTGSPSGVGECVYIGVLAGNGTGNYCVGIGRETLTATVTAATAVGYQAGKVTTGAGGVFLGYQAGLLASSGANNTILGYQAGASLTTNGGCVMIGYQAGNAETAANKLYIHNSSSTTPLIYGDFSTPSITFNGTVNIQDAKNVALGTTTGTIIATTTAQKLAFHGATAVIQRAGAAQAAVATTAATNTTPYGYTTAAQADAIVALVNEIRATLVEKGIMKGAA